MPTYAGIGTFPSYARFQVRPPGGTDRVGGRPTLPCLSPAQRRDHELHRLLGHAVPSPVGAHRRLRRVELREFPPATARPWSRWWLGRNCVLAAPSARAFCWRWPRRRSASSRPRWRPAPRHWSRRPPGRARRCSLLVVGAFPVPQRLGRLAVRNSPSTSTAISASAQGLGQLLERGEHRRPLDALADRVIGAADLLDLVAGRRQVTARPVRRELTHVLRSTLSSRPRSSSRRTSRPRRTRCRCPGRDPPHPGESRTGRRRRDSSRSTCAPSVSGSNWRPHELPVCWVRFGSTHAPQPCARKFGNAELHRGPPTRGRSRAERQQVPGVRLDADGQIVDVRRVGRDRRQVTPRYRWPS